MGQEHFGRVIANQGERGLFGVEEATGDVAGGRWFDDDALRKESGVLETIVESG